MARVTSPPVESKVTKRVTIPISSDGYNFSQAFASGLNATQRVPNLLPVTTKRWRLKARNASPLNDTVNPGAIQFTGVWKGELQLPTIASVASGRWNGLFSAAPSQVLAGFSTPADAADFATAWVEAADEQFIRGEIEALSWGMTTNGTAINVASDPRGLSWQTAASGAAGAAAIPAGGNGSVNRLLDIRLEIEFETLAVGGMDVGLFITDSIGSGWTGNDQQGAWAHEAWPGAAGLKNGFVACNLGVASTKLQDWTNPALWRWQRADLTTTVPDFAAIAAGRNDYAAGRTAAQMEADFLTIVGILRGLGIKRIYGCTLLPDNQTGTAETARTTYNNWLRALPAGLAGVFDFDKLAALQATPNIPDTDFTSVFPHPNRGAYQRMADIVRVGRR